MSRRHKSIEEQNRIQSCQRESRSDCSQKVMSDRKSMTDNSSKLKNFVITKKDGNKKCIALDVVFSAINKSIATSIDILNFGGMHDFEDYIEKALMKQASITEGVQRTILGFLEDLEESEETDNIAKRGRRKIQQLLGKFKNSEVVSWFNRIRTKFNKVIENLIELMVCFFCAVFDVIPSESRYGKATCFYEMIKSHLKEKIPSKSLFQKSLKWFKGWRKEVDPWENKQAEEKKHGIWERLYRLILNELPVIDSRLAMVIN